MRLADTAGKESSSYPSILEPVLDPAQQCPALQNPAHLACNARDLAHPTFSGEGNRKSLGMQRSRLTVLIPSFCPVFALANATKTTSQAYYFIYTQEPLVT